MEKLKINQEQSEELDRFVTAYGSSGNAMNIFMEDRDYFYNELKNFTPQQFALLLCGWYEVEKPFKEGEFVKYKDGRSFNKGSMVGEVYMVNNDKVYVKESDGFAVASRLERLSPEEISQEKDRRKWVEIGRETNGYQKNDVIGWKHDGKLIYRKILSVIDGGGVRFLLVRITGSVEYQVRTDLVKELIPHDYIVNLKEES